MWGEHNFRECVATQVLILHVMEYGICVKTLLIVLRTRFNQLHNVIR